MWGGRETELTDPHNKFSIAVVSTEKRAHPPPNPAPGSPIELVFCFDTTGSMYSCLTEVRKNVEEMIKRILGDISNIRIAVSMGDNSSSIVKSCYIYSNYHQQRVVFRTGKVQIVIVPSIHYKSSAYSPLFAAASTATSSIVVLVRDDKI